MNSEKRFRTRFIMRSVEDFPHRDLEKVMFKIDELAILIGDGDVPKGMVCVIDLGRQPCDFDGGLRMSNVQYPAAAQSTQPSASSPAEDTSRKSPDPGEGSQKEAPAAAQAAAPKKPRAGRRRSKPIGTPSGDPVQA